LQITASGDVVTAAIWVEISIEVFTEAPYATIGASKFWDCRYYRLAHCCTQFYAHSPILIPFKLFKPFALT